VPITAARRPIGIETDVAFRIWTNLRVAAVEEVIMVGVEEEEVVEVVVIVGTEAEVATAGVAEEAVEEGAEDTVEAMGIRKEVRDSKDRGRGLGPEAKLLRNKKHIIGKQCSNLKE
jgi:hypothetical protein